MKSYINRITEACPKWIIALWWILRLGMIYAFVASFFKTPFDVTVPVQVGLGFICMFAWEFCLARPKSALSLIPHTMQTVLILYIFAACFCGKFMGLYYSLPWLDPVLQFIFAGAAVFFGYEFSWALMKKEKYTATKAMAFFVAFGLTFVSINLLELFEFSFDQIIGLITGNPGDAQHWSYALAQKYGNVFRLLEPIDPARWPIMDTMIDIILNTIAAFTALLIVNIFPYRHKGRFRYELEVETAVAVPFEKPATRPTAKDVLKEYFQRLKNGAGKGTYALWWVIRFGMIILIVQSFFAEPFDFKAPMELTMNLACMFIWELSMAMPKKNVFRYVPAILQTIITVCVFITVIAGHVLNFYYKVRLWDSTLHFLSGIVGVYFGYEITCALFKMEKRTASLTQVLIASVGFCFMCTTFWEIFEFSCDQIVGMMTGAPHDVQHWSFAMAQGTAKEITIINPIVHERWPLMDTMIDIVLNTIGSFIALALIKIYPYRHKGRFKFVFDFENQRNVKAK